MSNVSTVPAETYNQAKDRAQVGELLYCSQVQVRPRLPHNRPIIGQVSLDAVASYAFTRRLYNIDSRDAVTGLSPIEDHEVASPCAGAYTHMVFRKVTVHQGSRKAIT